LTTKMLASTVQFSNNTPPTTHTHHTPPDVTTPERSLVEDGTGQKQQPLHKGGTPGKQETHSPGAGLFFQDPTGCLHHHTTTRGVPLHTRDPDHSAPRAVLETTPAPEV